MKPPHPLVPGVIVIVLVAIGLTLWQSEGAMIWVQQVVSYCF